VEKREREREERMRSGKDEEWKGRGVKKKDAEWKGCGASEGKESGRVGNRIKG